MIFLKIHFVNRDLLEENQGYQLSFKSKVGVMILSLAVASAATFGITSHIQEKETLEDVAISYTADVSLDDVNSMNLILNDGDCSDVFFQEVVHYLEEDGIHVQATKNFENINQDNSCVITLDQQYSAGRSTLIFAPYDNTRLGNSDSLAVAVHTAFDQNGFFVSDILCGKSGFEEDEDGNVLTIVPTRTEKAIDSDLNTSFTVISFGTSNLNAEWVAKSIENALARQRYYLDHYDHGTDLVYRANKGEDIDMVAEYFGTDSKTLKGFNHMKIDDFNGSQGIVNPSVKDMEVFNKYSMLQIDGEKTRAY